MRQQQSRRAVLTGLVAGSLGGCLRLSRTTGTPDGSLASSPTAAATDTAGTTPETTTARPWQFSMTAPGTTAPIVEAGTAYVGSVDHHLYGVDLATGERRFATDVGDEVGPGIVHHDGVVYGTGPGGIFGVDADGDLVLDVERDVGFGMRTPLVHGKTLYYPRDRMIALDVTTGEPRWTKVSPSTFGAQPALSNGVLVTSDAGDTDTLPSSQSFVYGLDPEDGATRWRRHVEEDSLVSPVTVSAAHGVAVLAGRYGLLAAFDVASGEERWRTTVEKGGNVPFRPYASGDLVYLPMRGEGVRAFDVTTGDVAWTTDGGGATGDTVRPFDGRLYTSNAGRVVEIDPASGERLAQQELPTRKADGTGVALTATTVVYPTPAAELRSVTREP